MEFFADLFGASYAGTAYSDFLNEFAGNDSVSVTHPATNTRIAVINDFLSGNTNGVVDLFQNALKTLTLPQLRPRFETISINTAFDNVRPYRIATDAQVHGVLDSGWRYLKTTWANPDGAWKEMEKHQAERTINDLIEKSIRNYMVSKSWSHKYETA